MEESNNREDTAKNDEEGKESPSVANDDAPDSPQTLSSKEKDQTESKSNEDVQTSTEEILIEGLLATVKNKKVKVNITRSRFAFQEEKEKNISYVDWNDVVGIVRGKGPALSNAVRNAATSTSFTLIAGQLPKSKKELSHGVKRTKREFTFVCKDEEELNKWISVMTPLAYPNNNGGCEKHFATHHLLDQRKIIVFVNPFSGTKKGISIWAELKLLLENAGLNIQQIITQRRLHAFDEVQKIDPKDCQGIVCISGDGLVWEVINGLMQRKDWETAIQIPLAVVPSGTGNALSATVGAFRDPLTAALIIVKGHVIPMDLWRVIQSTEEVQQTPPQTRARAHTSAPTVTSNKTRKRTSSLDGKKSEPSEDDSNANQPKDKEVNKEKDKSEEDHKDKDKEPTEKEEQGEKKEGKQEEGVLEDNNSKKAMKAYWSFLSVTWGIIADIDYESEKYRFMGDARYTVGGIARIMSPRIYKGKLYYLDADTNPPEAVKVEQDDLFHGPPTILKDITFGGNHPNWKLLEDDYPYFLAGNMPWISTELKAAPHAEINDGTIDLIYSTLSAAKASKVEMIKIMDLMKTGEYVNHRVMEKMKAKAFILYPGLESSKGKPGNILIDGERIGYAPIAVECFQGLARVMTYKK